MFFNTPAALSYVKNHQLRALGVSTAKRSMFLPDVPTIAESGLPGFDISVWFGLAVPKGTPHAIVERMHAAVEQALADPSVRNELIALGAEPVGDSPADFAQRMHHESDAWTKAFTQASMVLE
jgi:tripartite-type tricarboxylate transporter receptor subunit TctC